MKIFDLIGLKSYEFKLVSISQSLKFFNLVKISGACNLEAHFLLVSFVGVMHQIVIISVQPQILLTDFMSKTHMWSPG
jgi:hypothetical protein